MEKLKSAGQMHRKNIVRILRQDKDRVLVTEVLPYETPIIFDDEAFYNRLKSSNTDDSIEDRVFNILINDLEKCKIPYNYKIRHTDLSQRTLSLLHPASQIKIKKFYEEYENLMIYYCGKSPASIRYPSKVASVFFEKNENDDIFSSKTDRKTTESTDKLCRHSPSYFTYKSFDRLYKFFESEEYLKLEKEHSYLHTLDVTKCFNSIYTHTILWALKDKTFIKNNLRDTAATFGNKFDELMQRANHNETNGIIIGPEISRIFAEIILQQIDIDTINKLQKKGIYYSKQYEFKRYVDDVLIFAKDKLTAKAVFSCYTDSLKDYNLHVNESKCSLISRPFITQKSKIIYSANKAVNKYIESFLVVSKKNKSLKPIKIRCPHNLLNNFIKSIKSICAEHGADYDMVSSYLIAILNERLKRVLKNTDNNNKTDLKKQKRYINSIISILDAQFFLYSVSPTVAASYRVGFSIITAIRFAEKCLPDNKEIIKQRIFDLCAEYFKNAFPSSDVDKYVSLEHVNILLAAKELGDGYLFSENTIRIIPIDKLSYFSVISLLYYIENNAIYQNIYRDIINYLNISFLSFEDIESDSQKAHLFLDIMSCPYISTRKKSKWLKKFCNQFNIDTSNKDSIMDAIDRFESKMWYVNWSHLDILRSLEKKELKRVY